MGEKERCQPLASKTEQKDKKIYAIRSTEQDKNKIKSTEQDKKETILTNKYIKYVCILLLTFITVIVCNVNATNCNFFKLVIHFITNVHKKENTTQRKKAKNFQKKYIKAKHIQSLVCNKPIKYKFIGDNKSYRYSFFYTNKMVKVVRFKVNSIKGCFKDKIFKLELGYGIINNNKIQNENVELIEPGKYADKNDRQFFDLNKTKIGNYFDVTNKFYENISKNNFLLKITLPKIKGEILMTINVLSNY